jgi:hypothetical protein
MEAPFPTHLYQQVVRALRTDPPATRPRQMPSHPRPAR